MTPWTVTCQAPLSLEFSRQEYWIEWPFPSPGHLPNSVTEPLSPALQTDSLPSEPPGKPAGAVYQLLIIGDTFQNWLQHARYQYIPLRTAHWDTCWENSFPKFQHKFLKEIKSEAIYHCPSRHFLKTDLCAKPVKLKILHETIHVNGIIFLSREAWAQCNSIVLSVMSC